MLSQIFTRRYPDVSRNPVDLDPASATADVNRKFRHEFRAPIPKAQSTLKDSAT